MLSHSIYGCFVCFVLVCCHSMMSAAEYANLPLIRPFLQPGNNEYYEGVNFASSGAGALLETFRGSVRVFD